ncbi:MAG: HAD-IA family hydrolase [Desulfobacteraceae bacterium]|nr:HAD-IA family hydrolase [Desulfobacteraceae bacterium]
MVRACRIAAVLFDFDGTLTCPGALDFGAIRQEIDCPPDRPVLEFIQAMDSVEALRRAHRILEAHEMAAAALSEPAPGAEPLVRRLIAHRIPCGILTRNSRRAVERALENFPHIEPDIFSVLITRDTPVAPKPSGDGVHLAAAHFGVPVEEVLVVGDFVFDIEAGHRAGAVTAHVGGNPPFACHYAVDSLAQLWEAIRLDVALPPGKLPNDLLERFLAEFQTPDPSLVIPPGIGQDTAAVDTGDADTLVLTSDPITFVTTHIGHYAVLVNANDMATAGAVPRWLLTTLLFPPGITAGEIHQVFSDLTGVCRANDIVLCGGHTEITDAVSRPVVNGTMIGTVMRGHLIDKRQIRTGDRLLLTKAIAVEGTAIIAGEFAGELQRRGLPETVLARARDLAQAISVLPEAAVCRDHAGVSALHDVTEGGLATAARELASAGRCGLRLFVDRIPFFDETLQICSLMGIDPMGLIGSGSLLICCRPEEAGSLCRQLAAAGIRATDIGEITEAESGIQAEAEGRAVAWPGFDVDEITRLFGRPL